MMLNLSHSVLNFFVAGGQWLQRLSNGNSNTQGFSVRQPQHQQGQVWLIGAGPGDAELLTLKAYRLIQNADVVMYDWLVNPDILNMIPSAVERVFVGKKCGQHSMQQADICQLLVDVAQQGKNIVRLKGGDPAIFGRLAEECDILTQHNIDFAVVPGITSASGMSAYSGIPLTHRDCAQSVRFITAHMKHVEQEPDWSTLVPTAGQKSNETLVFYMGLNRLATISQRLIAHGMTATMPIAVIDQATLSAQKVCTGTLADISERVGSADFQGPALIIVGEVVTKRQGVNLAMLQQSTMANTEA
ncbi:uroporphyrinogen-III C-methyltransferase [Alteromonadaceae bacterium BrNp21-10]|nr:uroporphyrinogen-III C-methyltransferase [Alteromonadaceae bacterium BrNp21-10]